MEVVVQKYGGSSVADSEKIKKIAQKLKSRIQKEAKLVVVVSAMGKTTDKLLKLSREISDDPTPRELDMLLATGEQVSASLLAMALNEIEVQSISLNAFQAGIFTTPDFNAARIRNFDTGKINSLLKKNEVIVVTGFQGITERGELTTLGRGGSDTSAVALAAALGANCEIYSDFPGIYTIDPRLYSKAKKLDCITYDEMLEMASLGAKVLHGRSVEIAKKYSISLYCGATFSDERGTYIMNTNIEQHVVTGLGVMEKQSQVTISRLPVDYAFIHKIFENVAEQDFNVDMISMIHDDGYIDLSFTIIEDKKHILEKQLEKILGDFPGCGVQFRHDFVKISVVGAGMRSQKGVAFRFFKALSEVPVELVTTSEIKISCLVAEKYKDKTVQALAEEFEL